jgi:lipopolysaccharide export LptBFGC system permease protein LptF
LDNKNIKNEIIEEIVDIESNWYSAFKEFLIFSGVTFLLYCNYYLTNIISSVLYFRFSAQNKIESEINYQMEALEKYNLTHRIKVSDFTISDEAQLLQKDLKYNKYSLIMYFILIPIILGIIYLLFTQLNLRSKFRFYSILCSFIIVVGYYFNKEFSILLSEGDGIIFIVNCIIPFIVSFFLCLFVLLTPKNGKFSYYN